MSERMCPKADVYLNRECGVYHFIHDGKENIWKTPLEKLLQEIAKNLRGLSWVKEQRAELVVVGIDGRGERYVLNNPPIWAIEKLERSCEYNEMPALKRIQNKYVKKVCVFNMILSGPDAMILEAEAEAPAIARGYTTLYPEMMSLNTQELMAMMDSLMKLRMLNLAYYPSVRWLRSKYRK